MHIYSYKKLFNILLSIFFYTVILGCGDAAKKSNDETIFYTDNAHKCVLKLEKDYYYLENINNGINLLKNSKLNNINIIETLIDALISSNLDLSTVKSEEELKKLLVTKLKDNP